VFLVDKMLDVMVKFVDEFEYVERIEQLRDLELMTLIQPLHQFQSLKKENSFDLCKSFKDKS
jgi:hypothetical protein